VVAVAFRRIPFRRIRFHDPFVHSLGASFIVESLDLVPLRALSSALPNTFSY